MPATVPDEILTKIAKACVEPWTLTCDSGTTCIVCGISLVFYCDCGYWNKVRVLGLPRLENIKLASKLLHDEIEKATRDRFDGVPALDARTDLRLKWRSGLDSNTDWLRFLIKTVYYNDTTMEHPHCGLVANSFLSNLEHIVLDIGTTIDKDILSERPATLEEVLATSFLVGGKYLPRVIRRQNMTSREWLEFSSKLQEKIKVTIICKIKVEGVPPKMTFDFNHIHLWSSGVGPTVTNITVERI